MKLVLFGSGEFTAAVDQIDKKLIATFKPRNVAVLPTAAGAEKDVLKWIEGAQSHYSRFHLPVIPVPILNRADADNAALVNRLEEADWIFFSGGSPGYLIEVLRGSKLENVIRRRQEEGVLLAGSSAGAMAMGRYVLSHPLKALLGRGGDVWQPGLGLVNYSIIPHFDRWKGANTIFSHAPDEIRNSWMGIDEDTALLLDGDDHVVLGNGQVEIHDSAGIHQLRAAA